MSFNEIKCHVNTSLGLVGGMLPCTPPVSAPVHSMVRSTSDIAHIGQHLQDMHIKYSSESCPFHAARKKPEYFSLTLTSQCLKVAWRHKLRN